jgi:hypothetical protein
VKRAFSIAGVLLIASTACAQQRIGSVAMQDATVAGSLEVTGGRALLVGSSSVTARDHTAEVTLERGGMVRVCQTSGLHLSSGAASASGSPLMLALDRGAVELQMTGSASDVVLTPDLRFALRDAGPLDLRVRVTSNGDTCVEHRGAQAPTLVITNSFGDATYELHAGQHVLFEHGNLREVVDHESSPCGCPAPEPRTMSLAEASLAPNGDGKAADPAAEHPFPAAVSAGLAPAAEVPQAPPGEVHAQVSTSMTFEADAPAAVPVAPKAAATPAPGEKPHGFKHAMGRFFHRIFGGGND